MPSAEPLAPIPPIAPVVRKAVARIRAAELVSRSGRITRVMPTFVEANGPHASVGTICELRTTGRAPCLAEVVGVDEQRVVLVPFGSIQGVQVGDRVTASLNADRVPVGAGYLGRVVNALGTPLDGGDAIAAEAYQALFGTPRNPMDRMVESTSVETGVRAIDSLLTLARGQRIGVFAGSGVGKTTLLNSLIRNIEADVCIVCQVGERGREAEECWNKVLTAEQRARSVQVVSTSDEPAIVRTRAVFFAITLAEYFRAQGKHVLFVLDSLTRLAMALREIGLAVGEPPTVRAYTPSVFATLPRVIERFGALRGAGAITAICSVLTEDDSTDDPLAETIKALLDGHIVLSRSLAEQGQLPAIDVQRSVSRLFRTVAGTEEQALAADVVALLSTYEASRSLIDAGMYKEGGNPRLDRAVALREPLLAFLRQPPQQRVTRSDTLTTLKALLRDRGSRG